MTMIENEEQFKGMLNQVYKELLEEAESPLAQQMGMLELEIESEKGPASPIIMFHSLVSLLVKKGILFPQEQMRSIDLDEVPKPIVYSLVLERLQDIDDIAVLMASMGWAQIVLNDREMEERFLNSSAAKFYEKVEDIDE